MLTVLAVVALNVPDQQSAATLTIVTWRLHASDFFDLARHTDLNAATVEVTRWTYSEACESSSLGRLRLEKHGQMHVAQCLTEENIARLSPTNSSQRVALRHEMRCSHNDLERNVS